MDHGLNSDFLYSASRIDVTFEDDLGKKIEGAGTAFFVKNSVNELCLLTNRHVVDINYANRSGKYKNFKLTQLIVSVKDKNLINGLPTIDHKIQIMNIQDFKYSSIEKNDIACLKPNIVNSLLGSQPNIEFWIPYKFLSDKKTLEEKLLVCDFVAFPGFPDWYDKKNNLPILRTGTIASDPRFDYSFTGDFDGECIAFEAFSYGGSSGSPVFAISKGIRMGLGLSGGNFRDVMLIGMNAGHLPIKGVAESHSGISYMYKSYAILELIG